MDLYGRRQEQAALDRILDGARQGSGATMMLWGDPGIGKTALLEYVAESAAADFTVLRCGGTRLESGLTFAALHELLWPVKERISTLPEPQANALNGALGTSNDATDRFLIGVAVLTLVGELAKERPVLIVADDAQWLDEPSAQCLAFVARRLRNEPVVMLLTGHDDPVDGLWEKLAATEVRELGDEDARLLARAVAPHADESVIRRTIRAAAGNPLALQELTPSVVAGDILTHPLADERIAVGPRLRRAFRARIERLSAPARTALLLAAADDRSDRNTMYQAGLVLGFDAVAWDEALHSGLLTTRSDGRIRYRHQLMEAVVYEEAPPADRQAVHRALASVLTGENADELRPWHLAAALEAVGRLDEEVARLLEESAHRSWARGGCATAARALRRAAKLSPSTDDAARRLAHGARAAWEAGHVEVARGMLERAEGISSASTVADLSEGLRGLIEFAHGDLETACRQLTRDMERVADPGQAFQLGSMALRAAWAASQGALQREALQRLERRLPQWNFPNADLLPLLRQWWTEEEGGGADDRDQIVVPGAEIPTRLSGSSWLLMPPAPLAVAWGIESALQEALRREIDALRHTDQMTALTQALAQTVAPDIAQGAWTSAKANALEGLQVAEGIGDDHLAGQCRAGLGWLAAARGDEQAVADYAARTVEEWVPRGVLVFSAGAEWNLGMSALFAGRAEEALEFLVRLTEDGHHAAHPTVALLAAPDTAEAALQAGQRATAEEQARLLRRWAERSNAAWAVSATHLVDALLASGADAEKHFRLALEVPGAQSRPFNYARTRLLYGEWLRRARRRTDARTQLAEAAEAFQRLDAAPLLARTRAEQELTGQQPRRDSARARDTATTLTAQELRVVRLAAEGLTNREIGAQLLISPRTVAHHLANVFPKLGIVSRADLARVDFEDGLRLTG
ncbi:MULTISPECIES: AAA family ATPase [unclassified Streptomyces]|uniref:ATP-binding protein n=1 Tax=unclassified Streptomyces TaxID=2593676 RepID=UPI00225AE921|nr:MULTISPECIES: LuxR family transcriptional regulator [unclassified Streptomyces]MCX5335992.1 AAA family ATPase [Streptomyces sp. NBC_00140]MCX5366712.1 AAA family ATPase [Streptomyces sp. NBC_00124]